MKKNTKKFISSVVALSMAFTSVVSTSSFVSAQDELTTATDETASGSSVLFVTDGSATQYKSGDLEGFTFTSETSEDGTTKTSTWTFASTADSKDIQLGVANGVGDELEGIVYTGSGTKSWSSSNQFGISKTMGFKVPISENCTGGTISITGTGSNSERGLLVNGDTEKVIPYEKTANEYEFDEDDIIDGYISFVNKGVNDDSVTSCDVKISKIILTETLSVAADDNNGEESGDDNNSGNEGGETTATVAGTWDFASSAFATVNTGSTAVYASSSDFNLYIDATAATARANGNSVELGAGAVIYVPVNIGDEVTVTPYPNYGGYTVAGQTVGSTDNEPLAVTATEENTVSYEIEVDGTTYKGTAIEIVGTGGGYVVSIELTTADDNSGEEDDETTPSIEATWDFSEYANGAINYQGSTGIVEDTDTDAVFYVDATNGKFSTVNRSSDVQINGGTNIYIPANVGDKLAIKVNYQCAYSIGDVTQTASNNEGDLSYEMTVTEDDIDEYEITIDDVVTTVKGIKIEVTGTTYFYSIARTPAVQSGTEDEKPEYNGTLTASEAYTSKRLGEQVAVTFTYDGTNAPVNNITGFIEYNPEIAILTSGTITSGGKQVATLEEAIKTIPDTTIEGYEYLDDENTLTEAELGKVKIAQYFSDETSSIDVEDVKIELVFETKAEGHTAINFVPYGEIKNASNKEINLEITNTSIDVAVAPVVEGSYAIAASGEGITDVDGVYTLSEAADTFTVTISAAEALSAASITAELTYDSNVVVPVSAETESGSDLLPAAVIDSAIAYVPTSANPEFTSADGVKTAAELGKLKLANVVRDENDDPYDVEISEGDVIAVITFKKVAGGTTDIAFKNIETTNAELIDVVEEDTVATLTLTVEGEPLVPTTKLHLLGDVNHNERIDASDASKVLDMAKEAIAYTALEANIADVAQSSEDKHIPDATDAASVLDKAKNDSFRFEQREDAITIGKQQYIYIPADSDDDCAEPVTAE